MKMKIVPDVIGKQNLILVSPETTVRDAAKLMATHKIGAIMVGEGTTLNGIFTERDLAFRVVAVGRDPDNVKLAEVMTPKPDTLQSDSTAHEALERMSQRGYRHLGNHRSKRSFFCRRFPQIRDAAPFHWPDP